MDYLSQLYKPIKLPDTIIIPKITFHVLKLGKKKFRGKRRWFKKYDKEQTYSSVLENNIGLSNSLNWLNNDIKEALDEEYTAE